MRKNHFIPALSQELKFTTSTEIHGSKKILVNASATHMLAPLRGQLLCYSTRLANIMVLVGNYVVI